MAGPQEKTYFRKGRKHHIDTSEEQQKKKKKRVRNNRGYIKVREGGALLCQSRYSAAALTKVDEFF